MIETRKYETIKERVKLGSEHLTKRDILKMVNIKKGFY